jgi:hypothetical protein
MAASIDTLRRRQEKIAAEIAQVEYDAKIDEIAIECEAERTAEVARQTILRDELLADEIERSRISSAIRNVDAAMNLSATKHAEAQSGLRAAHQTGGTTPAALLIMMNTSTFEQLNLDGLMDQRNMLSAELAAIGDAEQTSEEVTSTIENLHAVDMIAMAEGVYDNRAQVAAFNAQQQMRILSAGFNNSLAANDLERRRQVDEEQAVWDKAAQSQRYVDLAAPEPHGGW